MGTGVERKSVGFFVYPEIRRYNSRMKGELGRNLRDTDAATSHDSLEDADDVCLDTHGATLNNGCRFTESAFKQIASHVCPGLSTFISDYSGTVASEHNQRGVQVDGVKAVTTWNELIRRRFHRFQAYRLVRNNSEKLIEGIISRKYSYLDNYALFNEACAALEANQRGVDFYGGLVIGRRVILWFRAETPMFTIEVDGKTWPFYHGYYFTNGEATGNAVQGTIAVFTPAGICLGGFKEYGGKLKHSGKNFHLRLGQMFTKVSQVEFPIESLQTGATALGKQSLGFEPLWEKAEQEERIKEIVTRLQMVGVAQRDGRDILQAALSHGRKGEGAGELVMETSRKYAGRKLIDLFVTMLTVARKIDLKKREKLEQAAFQLLMGTTQI